MESKENVLRCGMTINGKINLTRTEAIEIQKILMNGKGNMHGEINSELFSFEGN
jgi:hypothetical protein